MMTLTTVLLLGGKFAEGYCCANDLEQSIGRVFKAVARIVGFSPLLRDAEVMRDRVTPRISEMPSWGDC